MNPYIVVLTGAGMSAESGVATFRDSNGLWNNYDFHEVASIEGWHKHPEVVLEFYNQRRRQLKEVVPNTGHIALAELEKQLPTVVVTQNVDDLHERAGSRSIIHLHGELRKVRSTKFPELVYDWTEDLHLGDTCEMGAQLRPHIVWFGESVPMIEKAAEEVEKATHVMVIGTSMQVYPAAALVGLAPKSARIFYIDPNPAVSLEFARYAHVHIIQEKATTGVPMAIERILAELEA